jgi:hypothetical protein
MDDARGVVLCYTSMSEQYRLPKSLKNRVVGGMRSNALDPISFDWNLYKPNHRSGERIDHPATGAFFLYYMPASGGIWTEFAPAVDSGSRRHGYVGSDFDLVQSILGWLHVVKREFEAPDLWDAICQERALLGGDVVDGSTPFTAGERAALAERIDQLELQIKAIAPHATPSQAIHVHVSLEQAKEASGKLSRTDWKALFVGKLIDIVVTLGLDPQKAQQIIHYATIYVGPLIAKVVGLFAP